MPIPTPMVKSRFGRLIPQELHRLLSNKSESTGSFILFSELPTELRLKIWRYCLPPPGVARVKFQKYNQFYTTVPPPITLSICYESRQLALTHYSRLRFGLSEISPIYMDYSIDTIFIRDYAVFFALWNDMAASRVLRNKVKRLAVAEWVLTGPRSGFVIFRVLRSMRSLERVDVVYFVEDEKSERYYMAFADKMGELVRTAVERPWRRKKGWKCPKVRCVKSCGPSSRD